MLIAKKLSDSNVHLGQPGADSAGLRIQVTGANPINSSASRTPLGRKVVDVFKYTPDPAELAARQQELQNFKEAVGRALLKVEVVPRDGGPEVNSPAVPFAGVRLSLLKRHDLDVLPLLIEGKPLPEDALAKMEEAQRPHNARAEEAKVKFASKAIAMKNVEGWERFQSAAYYVSDLKGMYAEVLQAKARVTQQVQLNRRQETRAVREIHNNEQIEQRVMASPVTVQIRDLGRTFSDVTRSVEGLLRIIDIEGHMGLKRLADVARIDPDEPWLTIKMGDAFETDAIWLAIKYKESDIAHERRGGKSYVATKENPMDPELLRSEIKVKIKDVGETREDTMTVAQALQMLGVNHYDEIRDIRYTKLWKTVTVGEAFDLDAVKKAIGEVESNVRAEIASSKARAAGE